MTKLNELWQQLERQSGAFPRIRYDANSPCDLYLGLKLPEHQRLMALRLPIDLAKSIKNRPPSKGILVEKAKDLDDSSRFFLNLVLTDGLFSDVFDVLLADLINQLLPITVPKQAIQTFLNQLNRWEALFSQFSGGGLSESQQKGLYGELFVLRKLLRKLSNTLQLVESWVGNEAAIQDFRANNWAIEVKTSSQTTHERFTINGERQLDNSTLEHLFVYYLHVNTLKNGGESLSKLVSDLKSQLAIDVSTLLLFNRKLINAGYFASQADQYQQHGYQVQHEHIFRVTGDFPRIMAAELRPGVGEVHYSVSLSDCLPYTVSENTVIQILS